MARAYLGIGSNIDPAKNVKEALRLISGRLRLTGLSTVFRTEPVNGPGQAWFYNCVCEVETDLPAQELKFTVLRNIEDTLGRVRNADKNSERTMDIDLLLYDGLVSGEYGLTLPDPEIQSRPFLSIPLFELAPDLVLPGTTVSVRDLALRPSAVLMEPLDNYTRLLRRELGV